MKILLTRRLSYRTALMSRNTLWYIDNKRKSLLQSRITGLNLQGEKQRSIYFFKKEVKKTIFYIEISVCNFIWNCYRSFDEFREFYMLVKRDPLLSRHQDKLRVAFPSGVDGEEDVMSLVERRDGLEEFLKEVVSQIDYNLYEPLNQFIYAKASLLILKRKIDLIMKTFRRFHADKRLNMRLFKHYSKELMKFTYQMESGIQVYCIGLNDKDEMEPTATPLIMWIDICEEPALSRLCIASKEVFELPRECEDERLSVVKEVYEGLFLSDIAEVRKGASSAQFRNVSASCKWIRPNLCLVVVGSERTMNIQLIDESFINRSHLIDMINLLSLQSLSFDEIRLRRRKFRRIRPHQKVKIVNPVFLLSKLQRYQLQEGARFMAELLAKGIEVDEEVYSPHSGKRIEQRLLKYVPSERRLHITSLPGDESILPPNEPSDRMNANVSSYKAPSPEAPKFREGSHVTEQRARFSNNHLPKVEVGDDYLMGIHPMRESTQSVKMTGSRATSKDHGRMSFNSAGISDTLQQALLLHAAGCGVDPVAVTPEEKATVWTTPTKIDEETSKKSSTSKLFQPVDHQQDNAVPNTASRDDISKLSSEQVGTNNESGSAIPRNVSSQRLSLDGLKPPSIRYIDLDDISEIRPGKISAMVDGEEDSPLLTIVASATVVCLPLFDINIRNQLITKFQSFIQYHRNYVGLDSDNPKVYKRSVIERIVSEKKESVGQLSLNGLSISSAPSPTKSSDGDGSSSSHEKSKKEMDQSVEIHQRSMTVSELQHVHSPNSTSSPIANDGNDTASVSVHRAKSSYSSEQKSDSNPTKSSTVIPSMAMRSSKGLSNGVGKSPLTSNGSNSNIKSQSFYVKSRSSDSMNYSFSTDSFIAAADDSNLEMKLKNMKFDSDVTALDISNSLYDNQIKVQDANGSSHNEAAPMLQRQSSISTKSIRKGSVNSIVQAFNNAKTANTTADTRRSSKAAVSMESNAKSKETTTEPPESPRLMKSISFLRNRSASNRISGNSLHNSNHALSIVSNEDAGEPIK